MWRSLALLLAAYGMSIGPTVILRVDNSARIPVKILAQAEDVAARIFERAGVRVVWVEAPDAGAEPGPGEFRLHLIEARPAGLGAESAGYARLFPKDSGAEDYAGVSYAMVRSVASTLNTTVADILGITMAHEVGHLLLGARAHGRTGIMSPAFREPEARLAGRGELLFTQAQARQMRETLEELMARALRP